MRLEHDITLAEFIEDYWRLHAIPNLEPQTRRNYRQQWGTHILPRLGEYELRAINAQVILRELVEPMRRAGAGDPAASPRRAASDLRPRRHDGQGDRQPRQPRRQKATGWS